MKALIIFLQILIALSSTLRSLNGLELDRHKFRHNTLVKEIDENTPLPHPFYEGATNIVYCRKYYNEYKTCRDPKNRCQANFGCPPELDKTFWRRRYDYCVLLDIWFDYRREPYSYPKYCGYNFFECAHRFNCIYEEDYAMIFGEWNKMGSYLFRESISDTHYNSDEVDGASLTRTVCVVKVGSAAADGDCGLLTSKRTMITLSDPSDKPYVDPEEFRRDRTRWNVLIGVNIKNDSSPLSTSKLIRVEQFADRSGVKITKYTFSNSKVTQMVKTRKGHYGEGIVWGHYFGRWSCPGAKDFFGIGIETDFRPVKEDKFEGVGPVYVNCKPASPMFVISSISNQTKLIGLLPKTEGDRVTVYRFERKYFDEADSSLNKD